MHNIYRHEHLFQFAILLVIVKGCWVRLNGYFLCGMPYIIRTCKKLNIDIRFYTVCLFQVLGLFLTHISVISWWMLLFNHHWIGSCIAGVAFQRMIMQLQYFGRQIKSMHNFITPRKGWKQKQETEIETKKFPKDGRGCYQTYHFPISRQLEFFVGTR